MQKVEPNGQRRIMRLVKKTPCVDDALVVEQRCRNDGNANRSVDEHAFHLRFARGEKGANAMVARTFGVILLLAIWSRQLLCILMMLAAGPRRDNFNLLLNALRAIVRMMPAASKHSVDEQRGGC